MESKVDCPVTIVKSVVIAGDFGPRTYITMNADGGAQYLWVATGRHDYEAGERLALKGQVKGVEDYNGVPQVRVTRCKLEVIR